MVNLNKAQIDLLDTIRKQKDAVEGRKAARLWEAKQLEDADKKLVRETVQTAIDAGIPVRRIHLDGMGLSDYRSMLNWLGAAKPSLTGILNPVLPDMPTVTVGTPPPISGVGLRELGNDTYTYTSGTGDSATFTFNKFLKEFDLPLGESEFPSNWDELRAEILAARPDWDDAQAIDWESDDDD